MGEIESNESRDREIATNHQDAEFLPGVGKDAIAEWNPLEKYFDPSEDVEIFKPISGGSAEFDERGSWTRSSTIWSCKGTARTFPRTAFARDSGTLDITRSTSALNLTRRTCVGPIGSLASTSAWASPVD